MSLFANRILATDASIGVVDRISGEGDPEERQRIIMETLLAARRDWGPEYLWRKIEGALGALAVVADQTQGEHVFTRPPRSDEENVFRIGMIDVDEEMLSLAKETIDKVIRVQERPDISSGWSRRKDHQEHNNELHRIRRILFKVNLA